METRKRGTRPLGVAGVPWLWTRPLGAISTIRVFEACAPNLKLGIRFLKLRARSRTPPTGLGMAPTGFWSFPPTKHAVLSGYLVSVAR